MTSAIIKFTSPIWPLLTAMALLGFIAGPMTAQAITTEERPLRIGIIGSGAMGGPLGYLWAEAGHEVIYSSRNPEQLMDLVREAAPRATAGYSDAAAHLGDVILLAVPSGVIPQIGEDLAHLMEGKILIDITNPRVDRDGPIADEWLEIGTGVATAHYFPGAMVIKAFNALSAGMLDEAHRPGERLGIPIAGDHDEAVSTVASLVRDAGFEPVIVGSLVDAITFDRGTAVWVTGMTAREIREELNLPAPP